MKAIIIATLVAAAALLVVVFQNLAGANVNLLFWSAAVPMSLLLVTTYALGALTARPILRLVRHLWKSQTIVLSGRPAPLRTQAHGK